MPCPFPYVSPPRMLTVFILLLKPLKESGGQIMVSGFQVKALVVPILPIFSLELFHTIAEGKLPVMKPTVVFNNMISQLSPENTGKIVPPTVISAALPCVHNYTHSVNDILPNTKVAQHCSHPIRPPGTVWAIQMAMCSIKLNLTRQDRSCFTKWLPNNSVCLKT